MTASPRPITNCRTAGFSKPGRLPHVFQANEVQRRTSGWTRRKSRTRTIPRSPYNWVRVRLLGGRSLFWARQSFRLSDFEFKAADLEGSGENWPISLADLAPYYSRVEAIFRVVGRKEGWPQFPDGNFVEADCHGPPRKRDHQAVHRAWRARAASTSRRCARRRRRRAGWPVPSICCCPMPWPPASSISFPTPSCARSRVDKKTGLANGAHFVDRHSRREMHVKAKVVVLAAGYAGKHAPAAEFGIANSSGVLGHYLHDQIYGVNVVASVPEARDGKAPAGTDGRQRSSCRASAI